jgi:bifunctional non-homologous end joining protein LigD
VAPPLLPMLLGSAESPPAGDRWAFETKYDGMRTIVLVSPGCVGVWSKKATDFSAAFPELEGLGRALGGRSVVLDGELVCYGPDGRPSFARIRRRWAPGASRNAAVLAREYPATLVAFDLLELDGRRLTSLGYEERRAQLDRLELAERHWITTSYVVGNGAELLQASKMAKLEGLVAKRLGSRYRPGARSADWLKLKNYDRADFIIGAWLADENDYLEAIFVGTPGPEGLAFAGTVEFGLGGHRQDLRQIVEVIATDRSAFIGGGFRGRRVRHVLPRLRVRVRFTGWDAGVLREPIFEGLTLVE